MQCPDSQRAPPPLPQGFRNRRLDGAGTMGQWDKLIMQLLSFLIESLHQLHFWPSCRRREERSSWSPEPYFTSTRAGVLFFSTTWCKVALQGPDFTECKQMCKLIYCRYALRVVSSKGARQRTLSILHLCLNEYAMWGIFTQVNRRRTCKYIDLAEAMWFINPENVFGDSLWLYLISLKGRCRSAVLHTDGCCFWRDKEAKRKNAQRRHFFPLMLTFLVWQKKTNQYHTGGCAVTLNIITGVMRS